MNQTGRTRSDSLNVKELSYLKSKEAGQRRGFFKVFRILMVICFIVPFAFAWYKAAEGIPAAFSYKRFFIIASVLLFMSGVSTYFTYIFYIKKLRWDIVHKAKTIETSKISRKAFVPNSNTFYFYLEAASRLSIEVSKADFETLQEGDEINLEFSTYSREYLGYF